MPAVRITEFTDPACPWAYSAEPFRRRLDWLYGDQLEWVPRMVVLSHSPEDYLEKGFDTGKQAASFRRISRDHGMPIDTRERPRMTASEPACRAVVATRLRDPERAQSLLRCLRVHHFSGELLDEPDTIAGAARAAGLDPAELDAWAHDDGVQGALEEDMTLARHPSPAARVLDARLANWSGGRRYTCPSYEITRLADGVTISVPGFQPFAAYDVVFANLVPGMERREPAQEVEDVLAWAGTPLATAEVAEVCCITRGEAREALGRVATERHVGADGFWTLTG
jgi:2-hydroxychromene-2-carboxylate isomerase